MATRFRTRIRGRFVAATTVLAAGVAWAPAAAQRTFTQRIDLQANGLSMFPAGTPPLVAHATGVSWGGPSVSLGHIECLFGVCIGGRFSLGAQGRVAHTITLQPGQGRVDVAYPLRTAFSVPDERTIRRAAVAGTPVTIGVQYAADDAARIRTRLPYVDVTSGLSVAESAVFGVEACAPFHGCDSGAWTVASRQVQVPHTPSVAWLMESIDKAVANASVTLPWLANARANVDPCASAETGPLVGGVMEPMVSLRLCSPTLATSGGRIPLTSVLRSAGTVEGVVSFDADVDELLGWTLTGDPTPDFLRGSHEAGNLRVDFDAFSAALRYTLGVRQTFGFGEIGHPIVGLDFSDDVIAANGSLTRHLEFPLSGPLFGRGGGQISFTPRPSTQLLSVTPTIALSGTLFNSTSALLHETLDIAALTVKATFAGYNVGSHSFYRKVTTVDETIPLYFGESRLHLGRHGSSIALLTPEPSSALLVGTSLLWFTARAWRRRRRSGAA